MQLGMLWYDISYHRQTDCLFNGLVMLNVNIKSSLCSQIVSLLLYISSMCLRDVYTFRHLTQDIIFCTYYKLLKIVIVQNYTSSPNPGEADMRQEIKLLLVQIMAYRLFGSQPLSEPMSAHTSLWHLEYKSMKFLSQFKNIYSRNNFWEWRVQNRLHFVSGSVCW